MALTVTNNMTETFNMEGISDNGGTWVALGSAASLTAQIDIVRVGSGSISCRLDGGATGARGGMEITRSTPIDFDNTGTPAGMIIFWANTSSVLNNTATTGGITLRVGSDASNWVEWQVATGDGSNGQVYAGGWQPYTVDVSVTPDSTSGTIDWTAVDYFAIQFDVITDIMGNIQTIFIDEMNHLDATSITNGTSMINVDGTVTTSGALFSEIYADVTAFDLGVISNLGGAYQMNGSLTLGSAAGTATLTSQNEAVIFPNHRVNDGGFFINAPGNASGTQTIRWGAESGTPPNSVGSQGGILKSDGAGFDFIADNTNAIVELFGMTIDTARDITWTQTNAKSVSVTLVNCRSLIRGSGSEWRDGIITNSTAPSGTGAVIHNDNPTDPEFRDMIIQNCVHAMEWETDGANTLDLRNIKFINNTADLRYNHTTGLLTVNVLDGSDSPTTSDGGFGGTITIVSSQPLQVTVVEAEDFITPVVGARVGIHRQDNNAEILNTVTNGSGIASGTTSFTGAVFIRVRDEDEINVKIPAIVASSTGLTQTVALTDDNIYTPT